MAIVLAARRFGPYRRPCCFREAGSAPNGCGDPGRGMRKGRRWAACKGVRGLTRRQAPAPPPPAVLVQPRRPKLPREKAVFPNTLRKYLGGPSWKAWLRILERAGVQLEWLPKGSGHRRRMFTPEECRRVMEAWFRDLGAWRLRGR